MRLYIHAGKIVYLYEITPGGRTYYPITYCGGGSGEIRVIFVNADSGICITGNRTHGGQETWTRGSSSSVTNIAPEYSTLTFPIAAGTQCVHLGKYYYANTDIATSEEWTAGHWTATTVADELDHINIDGAMISKGLSSVADLNAITTAGTAVKGHVYTLSNYGTLSDGTNYLSVVTGDKVMWNDTFWELLDADDTKLFVVEQENNNNWVWPSEEEVAIIARSARLPLIELKTGNNPGDRELYVFDKFDDAGSYRYMYFTCASEGKTIKSTRRLGYDPLWEIIDANIAHSEAIAPIYSSSSTYIEGATVTYLGNLYTCTISGGITTAEEWTPSHWTQTNVTNISGGSGTAIFEYNPGTYTYPDGELVESAIASGKDVMLLLIGRGRTVDVFRYNGDNGPYNNRRQYSFKTTSFAYNNLNTSIILAKTTDPDTQAVSYSWYTENVNMVVNCYEVADTWYQYQAYKVNDLVFKDTYLYRCIKDTVAGQPWDDWSVDPPISSYDYWQRTNITNELSHRVYILYGECTAPNVYKWPTREEIDKIETLGRHGVVLFDYKEYTGGGTIMAHEYYTLHYSVEGYTTQTGTGKNYTFSHVRNDNLYEIYVSVDSSDPNSDPQFSMSVTPITPTFTCEASNNVYPQITNIINQITRGYGIILRNKKANGEYESLYLTNINNNIYTFTTIGFGGSDGLATGGSIIHCDASTSTPVWTYNSYSPQVNIGSSNKPIYIVNGSIRQFSSQIGNTNNPVFVNSSGEITACSFTVI